MLRSISATSCLFSFKRYADTLRGTTARTMELRCFSASSSIILRIAKASDLTSLIRPCPLHLGHNSEEISPSEGRRRWRDISSNPNRDIRPNCVLALSLASASCIRFSTALWFSRRVISIKSITISPPTSLKRSWRATSSAASRLVFKAVSSMSAPFVARAEFMSMETRASVGSITTLPPEGSFTSC